MCYFDFQIFCKFPMLFFYDDALQSCLSAMGDSNDNQAVSRMKVKDEYKSERGKIDVR